MGLRETLQNNQPIVAVVAVVIIAGSIVWMAKGNRPGGLPKQVYFYDVTSHELFGADRTAQPPVEAPKGGAGKGVKAVVYSCKECTPADIKIAYLTTYDDAARAAMAKAASAPPEGADRMAQETIEKGTLVAIPPEGGAEVKWVSSMTPEGTTIQSRYGNACGGQPPKSCFP